MPRLLVGKDDSTTCIWNACDQYTTAAVRGVEGNGQSSNCGRTNKDGIDYVKGATPGYERYIALYETPYEQGGCNGCRFFAMCKGQCPGTAIDNDWRNRSEHCRIWMALFEHFERKLLANGDEPLSVSNLRTTLEQDLVALWASGKTSSLQRILERGGAADLARDTVPSEEPTLSNIASRQPEFTRSVWVSDRAAAEWEDKIKRIAATWRRLEWRTVVKGVRKSALMLLSASELESLRSALGQVNMGVSVLQILKHRHPSADDGIVFRVAVGTPKALKSFRVAWVKRNHDAIGELLGYPRCCRSAFESEYLRSGHQDSTWQAAGGCGKPDGESHALEVKGPPQVNALLAKIGVRLIPHVPCSFACEESLRLARRFQRVADTAEEEESIEMALEMLTWPMAWSAVNGIAEIKTPIMKVNYGTDRVPQRRSIQYLGERYPEAAASGLQFPFRILHATR
jgi:uncharacterized protein